MVVNPLETWILNLTGNEEVEITPPFPLFITNSSLGPSIQRDDVRTSLVLSYFPAGSEEETSVTIATFFKNRTDNHMLMLNLQQGCPYVFCVAGPNAIDLVGYFLTGEDNGSSDGDGDGDAYEEDTLPEEEEPESREAKGKTSARGTRSSAAKASEKSSGDGDAKVSCPQTTKAAQKGQASAKACTALGNKDSGNETATEGPSKTSASAESKPTRARARKSTPAAVKKSQPGSASSKGSAATSLGKRKVK